MYYLNFYGRPNHFSFAIKTFVYTNRILLTCALWAYINQTHTNIEVEGWV